MSENDSFGKISNVISGFRGFFVRGIMAKWYALIAIPSMFIAYKVFNILDDMKIFENINNKIKKDLDMLDYFASKCTPKILQITEFIKCFDYLDK